MNIETQQHCQPWRYGKNGRFKGTIRELSQFDNKEPEELKFEFDHFDADNSYPKVLSSKLDGFQLQ